MAAEHAIPPLVDARARLTEIGRLAREWRERAGAPTLEPTAATTWGSAADELQRVLDAPPGYAAAPRETWPERPERSAPPRQPLLALTVHQPYAWAIAGGWKPVENRDWRPPSNLLGQWLAIHAGRQYDAVAGRDMVRYREQLGLPSGPPDGKSIALGAIVALARVAAYVEVEQVPSEASEQPTRLRVLKVRGAIGGTHAEQLAASPWASGPWLWVLQDVVAIDPIPCRGMQKLWQVPSPQLDRVRDALRVALAARSAP